MIENIRELKHLTTWQLLDYLIFGELSNEQEIIESTGSYSFRNNENNIYTYSSDTIKIRERSYNTNIFTKLDMLFPDMHGKIRYKQNEIINLLNQGTLKAFFIDENKKNKDLKEYIEDNNATLSQIKWEFSIAEVSISHSENSLTIKNLMIYFTVSNILKVFEKKNKSYTSDNKFKRVKELAERYVYEEGINNETILKKMISQIIKKEFGKGYSPRTLGVDFKRIKPKLNLTKNKVGRQKKTPN